MGSGADSTLILHPEGLSDISFDLTGAVARTGGYVVNLNTLRLNEDKRLEIAYSEGPNVEGGEAISSSSPLVPVTFTVIVYGMTSAIMIQKVETLLAAVTNVKGGTLEYKPDNLGDSVRSTFYHYVQSSPPRPRERWDRGAHDSGLYRMQVDVALQTQPFATSDPASPVSVLAASTLYNQDDGVDGHATVLAANIRGTEPALAQLRIRNIISGTWAAIQKLWYARRTEGALANFSPILEDGAPDTDSSVHWSTESDTTRRSNTFQRYAPPEAANDLWSSLYYIISSITDHEGKAAVAVVCRSLAEGREDWDLKAALQVANVLVETDIKNVTTVGMWTVCILGELDIPPTPISNDESYAIKLYLYLRRNTGDENSAIDIDFVQLLYVDEYPQQITIPDAGFTSDYKLLLENFDKELCHVVDQSSLALEKVAEPLCPLLKLRSGVDNRIDFIWERRTFPMEDDFEDYEAWHWLKVADFETDETWSEASGTWTADTVHYVEGSQGWKGIVSNEIAMSCQFVSLDLEIEGRFTDDDFVYVAFYTPDTPGPTKITSIRIRFQTSTGNSYDFSKDYDSLSAGWNYLKWLKSDAGEVGSPDWSNITLICVLFYCLYGSSEGTFDDLRIVRADPDDATKGNDTGDVWDFMLDRWHIYELDSTDKTLGCLDNTAGLEQVALIYEEPPTNIKFLAQVRAKRDDGEVGLVFRGGGAAGSEEMAAFFVDTTNDQLELRKWTAGSPSDIASAVSQTVAPDTDYWLGVWLIEDRVRCYFGTSKVDIWDDENEEFVISARKFDVTSTLFASGGPLASGRAGLLSIGTLGRFDDVELYGLAGHVPGDRVQVEAKAIYQTIYPFRE